MDKFSSSPNLVDSCFMLFKSVLTNLLLLCLIVTIKVLLSQQFI